MVGSIACGECESVDALHCGTDDNVAELGGARAGDLGDEPMLHALEGGVRLGKQAPPSGGPIGSPVEVRPGTDRPIVAYRGGCLTAQRSSVGCSHDISAAVAMPVMMQTISTIALTSLPCWGGCGVTENA
ncbi:MAG: hypothetical protein QOJ20_3683 [Mycobacterium sp.]|jgi:hypothetical protein|nr:hypothetical protein [Mycobacterium sp.]